MRYFRLKNVRFLGAHVYVHWSVAVVVAGIAALGIRTPIYAALLVLSYLGVIALHEAGHAIVASRLGYEVIAVRIGWFHGLCEYEAPDFEWEEVLVAWGGVAAQAIVGVPVVLLGALSKAADPGYFGPVLVFLGYINLGIAAFNLFPAEPFDGERAWRIIPMLRAQTKARAHTSNALRKSRKRT